MTWTSLIRPGDSNCNSTVLSSFSWLPAMDIALITKTGSVYAKYEAKNSLGQ